MSMIVALLVIIMDNNLPTPEVPMTRNRDLVITLQDHPARRKAMNDTPRTDAFIERLQALRVRSGIVEFAVAQQIHELMIAWAEFARELERDLNQSVPKEWQP
jgi:septum formation inhibitor-activating ATPase MinD